MTRVGGDGVGWRVILGIFYCIVLYLKSFLEASGAAFLFLETHVPGMLNMPKCQKVSK